MKAQTIDHMFNGLTFTKNATEIRAAATKKSDSLKAKIEDRQKRIADLRREHGIDDAALVQLLTAARKQAGAMVFTYNSSVQRGNSNVMEERQIGAGTVNNLLTENDYIEAEKDNVAQLEMITRNLKDIPRFASGNGVALPPEEFHLSFDELKYLGF